jgi:hypothetical protein
MILFEDCDDLIVKKKKKFSRAFWSTTFRLSLSLPLNLTNDKINWPPFKRNGHNDEEHRGGDNFKCNLEFGQESGKTPPAKL